MAGYVGRQRGKVLRDVQTNEVGLEMFEEIEHALFALDSA